MHFFLNKEAPIDWVSFARNFGDRLVPGNLHYNSSWIPILLQDTHITC